MISVEPQTPNYELSAQTRSVSVGLPISTALQAFKFDMEVELKAENGPWTKGNFSVLEPKMGFIKLNLTQLKPATMHTIMFRYRLMQSSRWSPWTTEKFETKIDGIFRIDKQ